MCDCCNTARLVPDYRLFCPTCLHCGVRKLQREPLWPWRLTATECKARRQQTLAHWVAHGHDEAEMRALFKKLGSQPALCPQKTC